MYVKNDKNPGSAFLMGLVVPGTGMMYNDQVEMGFGALLLSAGLVGGGYAVYSGQTYTYRGGNRIGYGFPTGEVMMIGGGVVWLGSAVYSAFLSRKINRQNGVDKRLSHRPKRDLSIGLTAAGPGLSYVF